MLARKTSKNQLTSPKEIVAGFPGVDLLGATVEDNRIVPTPVKITPVSAWLNSIRDKMEKLGIVPEDVAKAIEWARK
jgi:hypothetical protein